MQRRSGTSAPRVASCVATVTEAAEPIAASAAIMTGQQTWRPASFALAATATEASRAAIRARRSRAGLPSDNMAEGARRNHGREAGSERLAPIVPWRRRTPTHALGHRSMGTSAPGATRIHRGVDGRRLRPASRPSRHGLSNRNPNSGSIEAWAKYATSSLGAHAAMLKRRPPPAPRHGMLSRRTGFAYLAHAAMGNYAKPPPQLHRSMG